MENGRGCVAEVQKRAYRSLRSCSGKRQEVVLGMDYCGKQKREVPLIEGFLHQPFCTTVAPQVGLKKMRGIKL